MCFEVSFMLRKVSELQIRVRGEDYVERTLEMRIQNEVVYLKLKYMKAKQEFVAFDIITHYNDVIMNAMAYQIIDLFTQTFVQA